MCNYLEELLLQLYTSNMGPSHILFTIYTFFILADTYGTYL